MTRYFPTKMFPSEAYTPGQGSARSKGQQMVELLDKNEDNLRYGLDLLAHDYYWEAHVYLEAVWHALVDKREKQAVQALIHLAAAGVKMKQQQLVGKAKHIRRSQELWGSNPEIQILRLPIRFPDFLAKVQ